MLTYSRDEIAAYLDGVVDLEPTPDAAGLLDGVAEELHALDRRPGEVVLVALANGAALLRCFFGVLLAGGVPALVPPGTPTGRIREIADRIGARTLITTGHPADPPGRRQLGPVQVETLTGVLPQRHEPGHVVILTSGTSGVASGCLHRFSSLTRNAARHARSVGLRADDTILVNLPLYFSYALVAQALAGLVTGARLVIAGPPFTPAAYWTAVREHAVTSSSVTPYMVRGLVAADWRPPPSLRMLTVGGESLDPATAGAVLDRSPGLELYLTYGLTEAGPRVSTLAAHREPRRRLGTVGRPLDGVRVALRDPGPDGVGELLVTSDTVLRRKVGVAEGRVGDCLVGPDQIATGDLFLLDDDGYLHFRGRLSDFVVTGGTKVSLASVRRIANALPNVIASATRTYQAHDGTRFDLDLYLYEADPVVAEEVRRELRRQLVRTEWPSRIRTLSLRDLGHK
ncbi:class I adenylate-forming enzyme family protein [Micromonospora sp. KC213]|uniref:class I adenylate-forming enzyme family protein n=1 Tax=Micromonospora sp. KC213 TaxID=2530378 RepID=UPI001405064C|nr:class I adenylate-forming enzyme family protein [Micromonospora sp. KC213]